jgi:hypothetical protein
VSAPVQPQAEPITVRRWRCPHCHKSWSSRQRANSHAETCFRNPAARSCLTCAHHEPGDHGGYHESPTPEMCEAAWDSTPVFINREGEPHAGPELRFPQLNCPMWDPGEWLGHHYGENAPRWDDADFPLAYGGVL